MFNNFIYTTKQSTEVIRAMPLLLNNNSIEQHYSKQLLYSRSNMYYFFNTIRPSLHQYSRPKPMISVCQINILWGYMATCMPLPPPSSPVLQAQSD